MRNRLLLFGVVGLALWAAPGRAQSQLPDSRERPAGPTVDFLALAADGLPAAGLTSADVEVRIDGRARRVRSLRFVTSAPVTEERRLAALAPPYGVNGGRNTGRTFVLVVDDESFLPGSEAPLRNAVDGLLTHLAPADRVMLVSVPYVGERLALTREHARLRTAMSWVTGQRPRGESGSAMACRTRLVLQSLTSLLERFAGGADPSVFLVFTSGLAGPRRDAPMAMAPGMCELAPNDFKRVGMAAGAARATVYLIQPDDLPMSAGGRPEGISGTGFTGSDNPLEGIEHLAGVTGGERIPLTALGTAALARVARETSGYYVAELEPDRQDTNGRTRSLNVRISRRDVTVRARPEITFAPSAPSRPAVRLTAAEILRTSEGFPDLPLRASAYAMEPVADGRLKVVAVADVLDRSVPIESASAALIDGRARIVAQWHAPDAGESPLMGAMLVAPGAYRLRVAVVDVNGRAGAADFEFDAVMASVGSLRLGSLVMGLSRDGVLNPRLEFGDEPSALASFVISGGVAGLPLVATLEVAREPDGPPMLTVPLTLSSLDEQRVLAMGTVPLGALPSGDFVVRAVIRLEDGTSGRVFRTLRKR